ncbi:hypothetical protein ASD16_05865 [Cellulomonas sp. Root485]|uniref:ChbG/HpnK family deacetylase n=1 Tax=Cellulomonas sp. Root485 TaxID=1736546 RepID=UPI0006FDA50B|nr:ChbG/HpnK family deacetylase [Cellulomonas sp. Root485]KQY24986.1 hypothetical protein ASD16_05865 [Cellulomonas sp. Root485]
MTRLLIVTADDLGLTRGVNAAVRRAHEDGIVTATSLLAVGREFDDAAAMLRDLPTLELGAHLALVGEDPPLLSAREIPTLVDARGAFPLSYRTVVRRGLAGRLDPDDVRRELSAQLQRVLGVGVPLTHLDTHQHTHLWPTVATVVAELAREAGVPAVRLPGSHSHAPVGLGVRFLSRRTRSALRAAGRATTQDYAGLDEAGHLDADRFRQTLQRAARRGPRTLEINTHPALAGDADLRRFTWDYQWADELAMLLDPAVRDEIAAAGFTLGGFAALTTSDGAA